MKAIAVGCRQATLGPGQPGAGAAEFGVEAHGSSPVSMIWQALTPTSLEVGRILPQTLKRSAGGRAATMQVLSK
jgi:hypothetical protein